MRKLLAFLLSISLLCAFAGIGAHAATLEEEARALVEETLAVLQGGRYAYLNTFFYPARPYVVDGDKWGYERNAYPYSGPAFKNRLYSNLTRLFYGEKERVLYLPDQIIHYYPNRWFYYEESYSGVPSSLSLADIPLVQLA